MASLHPTHGARVVLERDAVDTAGASYRVTIYEPGAVVHEGRARIGADGASFDPWTSEPPAWSVIFTERLLKGLPKKHAADASWPRKITRWRSPE